MSIIRLEKDSFIVVDQRRLKKDAEEAFQKTKTKEKAISYYTHSNGFDWSYITKTLRIFKTYELEAELFYELPEDRSGLGIFKSDNYYKFLKVFKLEDDYILPRIKKEESEQKQETESEKIPEEKVEEKVVNSNLEDILKSIADQQAKQTEILATISVILSEMEKHWRSKGQKPVAIPIQDSNSIFRPAVPKEVSKV